MTFEVQTPTLERLKTKECSKEELQAALVKLIGQHNVLVGDIAKMLERGQILSTSEAARHRESSF